MFSPLRRQPIAAFGFAGDEGLGDRDIAGIFKPAKMSAEVPVAFLQKMFEAAEGHGLLAREQHTDGKPASVLQQLVEACELVRERLTIGGVGHRYAPRTRR